jgi:hypothetical protein
LRCPFLGVGGGRWFTACELLQDPEVQALLGRVQLSRAVLATAVGGKLVEVADAHISGELY